MKAPRLRQKGISLVEALIAVVLVSFGVLGLVRLQSAIHANSVTGKARTQAQLLAREILDSIASAEVPSEYGVGEDSVPGSFTTFGRAWDVRANPVGDTTATVTVRWSNSRGQDDYVTLSAILNKDIGVNEGKLLAAVGTLSGAGTSGMPTAAPPWTVGTENGPTPPTQDSTPDPTPQPPPSTPDQMQTRKISGAIVVTGKADIKHVTISANNGGCALAGSAYSCTVPNAWSGKVTVTSVANQKVAPGSRSYSNVTADISGQNYTVSK